MQVKILCVFLIGVSAVGQSRLFGQADSDYFAYPDGYTPMQQMVTSSRQLTLNRLSGISEDYRLGPDDVVMVEVVGTPTLGTSTRIDAAGAISLPLIGQVPVGGMTATEAEAAIAERLAATDLLVEPEVLIYVTEYNAKPIFVLGQVDRPGEFVMSQELTFMDAVLVAGGLDFSAGQYGYLHRKKKGSDRAIAPQTVLANPEKSSLDVEIMKFDLTPMKQGGVLENNPRLQGGDVIVVPRRDVETFYVIGDVKSPGAYEILPQKTVTISEAIAWAGGPSKTANMKDSILVRGDGDARTEIPANFRHILEGRTDDFALEPGDVIFVPGSNAKTLGMGALNTIPNLARQGIFYF